MYGQEIWFVSSEPRLMMFYTSTKFHENILNGFQVIERTKIAIVKFQRELTPKMYRQE